MSEPQSAPLSQPGRRRRSRRHGARDEHGHALRRRQPWLHRVLQLVAPVALLLALAASLIAARLLLLDAGSVRVPAAALLLGGAVVLTGATLERRRRRRRRARAHDLEVLRAMSATQFVQLLADHFRRHGWSVALAEPDGDGALWLRRSGRRLLVHTRDWRRRTIDVDTVQAQHARLLRHDVDACLIVGTGEFTAAARAFARARPLELHDGDGLLALLAGPAPAPRPAVSWIERQVHVAPARARDSLVMPGSARARTPN